MSIYNTWLVWNGFLLLKFHELGMIVAIVITINSFGHFVADMENVFHFGR